MVFADFLTVLVRTPCCVGRSVGRIDRRGTREKIGVRIRHEICTYFSVLTQRTHTTAIPPHRQPQLKRRRGPIRSQPDDQCPYMAQEREMRSGPITYWSTRRLMATCTNTAAASQLSLRSAPFHIASCIDRHDDMLKSFRTILLFVPQRLQQNQTFK